MVRSVLTFGLEARGISQQEIRDLESTECEMIRRVFGVNWAMLAHEEHIELKTNDLFVRIQLPPFRVLTKQLLTITVPIPMN